MAEVEFLNFGNTLAALGEQVNLISDHDHIENGAEFRREPRPWEAARDHGLRLANTARILQASFADVDVRTTRAIASGIAE